jgi:hypothetical protein
VERYKYLGWVLSHDDNNIAAMPRYLQPVRVTRKRVSKILTREEVPAPVAGMFYQAVVALVILYEGESWGLPPSGIKVLEGFHVEAARRRTGICSQWRIIGRWVYPKSRDVMTVAHLKPVATYIARHRHKIAKIIEGRTLWRNVGG